MITSGVEQGERIVIYAGGRRVNDATVRWGYVIPYPCSESKPIRLGEPMVQLYFDLLFGALSWGEEGVCPHSPKKSSSNTITGVP